MKWKRNSTFCNLFLNTLNTNQMRFKTWNKTFINHMNQVFNNVLWWWCVCVMVIVLLLFFSELWLWIKGWRLFLHPVSCREILERKIWDLPSTQRLWFSVPSHCINSRDPRERRWVRTLFTGVKEKRKKKHLYKYIRNILMF